MWIAIFSKIWSCLAKKKKQNMEFNYVNANALSKRIPSALLPEVIECKAMEEGLYVVHDGCRHTTKHS